MHSGNANARAALLSLSTSAGLICISRDSTFWPARSRVDSRGACHNLTVGRTILTTIRPQRNGITTVGVGIPATARRSTRVYVGVTDCVGECGKRDQSTPRAPAPFCTRTFALRDA
ncbi:hypothetical protein EVAR_51729_1 [Eumeta japonica]|uniref:Secreted protein n=1 Tax=Eumeta variegata TaxID=151549 RepID=A0A4C1XKH9_EUMVA|nr:hypothetical protein EVAR_51729_1 [Eumeta japonica]